MAARSSMGKVAECLSFLISARAGVGALETGMGHGGFRSVVISRSPTAWYAAIRGLPLLTEAYPSDSLFTGMTSLIQSSHGCSVLSVP